MLIVVTSSDLKILYTNADQFVNKCDDLLMLIAGNEPDIIFINEAIPKTQSLPIGRACLELPNSTFFTNFDPDSFNLGSSGICGMANSVLYLRIYQYPKSFS